MDTKEDELHGITETYGAHAEIHHDSHVTIYHGPRRGGKTVTMSHDGGVDLVAGRKVYSNYPVAFDIEGLDNSVRSYATEPLLEDELLLIDRPDIKRKYNDSVVLYDEGAISLYSRDFMKARNRLMGIMLTLIGKLEMNFYLTVQFLSLLEKNVKLQMDALMFCHDLSFKIKRYERGAVIGQSLQDMSGRFTGEMYEFSGRIYNQRFYAKPFWRIYNTKQTFPILQKNKTMKELREGVTQEGDGEDSLDYGPAIVAHMVEEFKVMGQPVVGQPILVAAAKARGFTGTPGELGFILMSLGGVQRTSGGVNRWDFRVGAKGE